MSIPVGQLPACGCLADGNGSQTAKGGFNEEKLVCDDFATNPDLGANFCELFGIEPKGTILGFSTLPGTSKTDCISSCSNIRLQVKKGKKGQSGQVDRHWVDSVVDMLPCLMPIRSMLKGMCEYNLMPDGTVDKTSGRKKLTLQNYTQDELDGFVNVLNDNRRKIAETILMGTDEERKPTHMAYVSYENAKRRSLKIWRMTDIVDSFVRHPISISSSGTTFKMGDALSFQRKGGDGGKRTSNQIQAKITPSKIDVAADCHVLQFYYS